MAVSGRTKDDSNRTSEVAPTGTSGFHSRRSGGSGRAVVVLGVVLAVLMSAQLTGISPVAASGAPSYSVLETVSVGTNPGGVAVTPDGSRVYVTNAGPGTVSVISTATNTVPTTVTVGSSPLAVALTPDGSAAYVANFGAGSVSVISTATNTVSATVTVGSGPYGVAVTPDGSRVYVTNSVGNSVSVISTATNTVSETVSVGSAPYGVAVTPDGSRVYVTNAGAGTVGVISTATNTVSATVTVGSAPYRVAVTPDGSRVYVTNSGGNSVSVISTATNTVSETVTVGSAPYGVAVSPDGSRVYTANFSAGSVSVISTATNTVSATATVGSGPYGVAVTPDSSRVYATNAGAGTVSVIDAGPAVTAPAAPTSLSAAPGNGSASISFTAGADGGAAITKYQYQLGSGSWTDAVGTTSPISISGLTNGTSYSIKLRAVNIVGTGAASASTPVTPRTVPSAPTSVSATAGVGAATISFTPGADGGAAISKYQVKIGTGAWTDVVGTTSPITISGLTSHVTASIRLRAVNSVGAGASSTFVQVWPRIAGPSLTSVNVEGSSKVRASFAALTPVGGTTSHYWVYAYTKGTNTIAGSCRSTTVARSCAVTGLSANTEYDVVVRGFFTLTGSPTVLPTFDSARQTVRTNS